VVAESAYENCRYAAQGGMAICILEKTKRNLYSGVVMMLDLQQCRKHPHLLPIDEDWVFEERPALAPW